MGYLYMQLQYPESGPLSHPFENISINEVASQNLSVITTFTPKHPQYSALLPDSQAATRATTLLQLGLSVLATFHYSDTAISVDARQRSECIHTFARFLINVQLRIRR